MDIKLYDSELKVMEVLWGQGEMPARSIVDVLSETVAGIKTQPTQLSKNVLKRALLSAMSLVLSASHW